MPSNNNNEQAFHTYLLAGNSTVWLENGLVQKQVWLKQGFDEVAANQLSLGSLERLDSPKTKITKLNFDPGRFSSQTVFLPDTCGK